MFVFLYRMFVYSGLCILCFYIVLRIVLSIVFPLVYNSLSLLCLCSFIDHCHRVETQLE